jgi:hypothetical protein
MRRRAIAIAAVLGCGPETATDGREIVGTSGPETSADGSSASTESAPDLGDWPPGFIRPPDAASASNECSVFRQDCPRGDKCMPWSPSGDSTWNGTRCSPIAPDPRQQGEACTVEDSGFSGVDDCDIASMCWNVDRETSTGYCVSFCVGSENDPFCLEPNHHCSTNGEGTLILCLAHCDPLAQDCNREEGCWGVHDQFVCAPDASGGMGAYGDPCESINVCDPGLFCAPAGAVPDCASSGCCSPYCALDQPNTCPGEGQECLAAFDPSLTPPGYENVGLCAVPS